MPQPGPVTSLPQPVTTFVGRERELDDIAARLDDAACRLLSLVGPGGAGKTRLAIEAARLYAARRGTSVHFAALDEVPDPGQLPVGIATAIGIPLVERDTALDQLARAFEERDVLLLLDNFEHLVDGAAFLADLLAACPGLRLVVTSRVMLNLAEEWVAPVDGLDCADEGEAGRLFLERARRVNPQADVPWAEVARICRLVGGMPLALEIAASWTRTLPCDAVAAEIERSLAFLAGGARNVPERHRSVVAVFDQSWQRLTAAERDVFLRLSVFDGGFTRDAAAQVAGATLPVLAALVEQCLVRHDANGRYRLHELTRQYGREKLSLLPGELDRVRDAHAGHFLQYAAARRAAVGGRDAGQATAVADLEAELPNIRAAWEWAVRHRWWELLFAAFYPLRIAFEFRGRYLEAYEITQSALAGLEGDESAAARELRAFLLVGRTWLHVRFGRIAEATADAEAREALGVPFGPGSPDGLGSDPDAVRALVALVHADYETALTHAGMARWRAADAPGQTENLIASLYLSTSALLGLGRHDEARQTATLACDVAVRTGNRWFEAYPRGELGKIERAMGNLDAANAHFAACYELRKPFDDPEGMGMALANMGRVAVLRGDAGEAERLYRSALQLYRRAGDRGGMALAAAGMAACALLAGDIAGCRSRLHDALATAREMDYGPVLMDGLLTAADMRLRQGNAAGAAEVLHALLASGRADGEQRTRAEELLAMAASRLTPAALSEARRRGAGTTLDDTGAAVLASLRRAAETAAPEVPGLDLTPRELDVMRLMAEGQTNAEIAVCLDVTAGIVKWYTSQIFSKLDVKNWTAAVARARELGLVG
ncbi:MAG: tetratricopeptide repeat protein [Dehalococcoidia bacterium]|nr:tetratricopeptide repeat protein [Dehalococcoidia bacterium]